MDPWTNPWTDPWTETAGASDDLAEEGERAADEEDRSVPRGRFGKSERPLPECGPGRDLSGLTYGTRRTASSRVRESSFASGSPSHARAHAGFTRPAHGQGQGRGRGRGREGLPGLAGRPSVARSRGQERQIT
ncbi:hypothetical protein GCM10017600_49150 [Streptosporangium carneum]|uniref:Uncharacterized protein n=1 Tax=Streptosporangium carneum TaxID=47481 RepID=A0A9W6I4F9_9ACTN|nr:hypothetical protein GCM10017600_49150 [Streptosporangium carneum]